MNSVAELFPYIEENRDEIEDRIDDGQEYWETVLNFWDEVKFRKVETISDKQLNWLRKIEDSL